MCPSLTRAASYKERRGPKSRRRPAQGTRTQISGPPVRPRRLPFVLSQEILRFSLSILSIFDVPPERGPTVRKKPCLFDTEFFPIFRGFLEPFSRVRQASAAFEPIYIRPLIIFFYEELSTLSTGFSTMRFPAVSTKKIGISRIPGVKNSFFEKASTG